jgi:phosphoribosylanthranilate isomerase
MEDDATTTPAPAPVRTQIYGITTAEDAALVNALRPDHVGVVLDEGIDTWDSVDLETLRAIRPKLQDVAVVALSLSVERDRILRTADAVDPGWVHLARAAEALEPEALARLREALAPRRLMLTIPVRDEDSIRLAQRFAPHVDALLTDSAHPSTGVVGATGHTHDWSLSARIVAASVAPVFLAGGLGPENVAEAIERTRPAGVDSETRTSDRMNRRRKDPERVRQFLERAHAAGRSRGLR